MCVNMLWVFETSYLNKHFWIPVCCLNSIEGLLFFSWIGTKTKNVGKLSEQKKSSRGQILQVVLLRHFSNSLHKWCFFLFNLFFFNLKSESVHGMRCSIDCLKHWTQADSICPYVNDVKQHFLVSLWVSQESTSCDLTAHIHAWCYCYNSKAVCEIKTNRLIELCARYP